MTKFETVIRAEIAWHKKQIDDWLPSGMPEPARSAVYAAAGPIASAHEHAVLSLERVARAIGIELDETEEAIA